MKEVCYQIVQFSFQKDESNLCFIELFQLPNNQPFNDDTLVEKLESKAKTSEEKQAINMLLEQFEQEDVQIDTLNLLANIEFDQAILKKHECISQVNSNQWTLLNQVTSANEDKELLSKRYTLEVIGFVKKHHDEYESVSIKDLSKIRNCAVKLMLTGLDLEAALDQAYDQVIDS